MEGLRKAAGYYLKNCYMAGAGWGKRVTGGKLTVEEIAENTDLPLEEVKGLVRLQLAQNMEKFLVLLYLSGSTLVLKAAKTI